MSCLWTSSVIRSCLLNEQSEILDELNEVVRSTEQVRLAQDAGALLRLPTGDGVALIFAVVRRHRRNARWKSRGP